MNAMLKKQFADKYANNYVETSVTEASPHKLVEMLYSGALRHIKVAKVFIEQANHEKKSFHINKALSIISGLKSGINFDEAEEIAGNFFDLYDFCYRTLVEASQDNSIEKADEVIEIIQGLHDAWQQMPSNFKEADELQLKRLAKQ
jgi:flagellar protein FliS